MGRGELGSFVEKMRRVGFSLGREELGSSMEKMRRVGFSTRRGELGSSVGNMGRMGFSKGRGELDSYVGKNMRRVLSKGQNGGIHPRGEKGEVGSSVYGVLSSSMGKMGDWKTSVVEDVGEGWVYLKGKDEWVWSFSLGMRQGKFGSSIV
jgi:hypothetical protein